ncbi:MAG: ABC transporter permease [Acutalibacter sp.]|jgi:putative aldouronate transport system permease protein
MSQIAKTTDRGKTSGNAGKKRQGKIMFFMILPFLILNFLFAYFPLHGWIYAFYDYRAPLKLSQCDFVGLKWFTMLFSNPTQMSQLGQVMINTFAMSLLGIATSILPLFFAIFLSEIQTKWFQKSVQTLTTLPNFISWVLVYSVAFSLFSNSGMVNNMLQQLGIISEPIKFLDSDTHTWLSMILWSTWKGLGWNAIMYLAAITGIDPGLYEAARIDGAGRFRLMFHITLPELLPTFFVLLMLSIANFLNNGMDQYYVFQNSFNKTHIQVLDLYVYNIGITGGSFSLSTAIGMLKSIVSIVLLTMVNFASKRIRGESLI